MVRIAVVSDVHGNLTAYRAVLEDAERRGADVVLNLGDVAGKGPRGSECVQLTRERCALTVMGNWEVVLSDLSRRMTHPGMQWWRAELTDDDRAWMRSLPVAHHLLLSGRQVRFVHASTDSPFTRIWRHHSKEEFDSFFAATPLTERDGPSPTPDVAVYGDLHHAYSEVIDGRTLINCGSAGNPLDEDPQLSYLLLEGELGSAEAAPFAYQFVRVPYDVDAEVAVARDLAMPLALEYEVELRTGVYRSLHVERGLRTPPVER
ncbi:MAG: metallophosphoesterase family protein [Quadrisphaera sp.]